MKKINGVYSIIHIVTGKTYIGSALNIEKRWSEHKSELKHNNHDNQRLQNAWNKYGEDAFEFVILEKAVNPIDLLQREQYWMDKLQSYDRYKGFNIRRKAESNLGLKHKPETIEKIKQFGQTHEYPDRSGINNGFFGKSHDEETLKKMRTPRSQEARKSIAQGAQKRWEGNHISKVCGNCQKTFDTIQSENNDFCSKKCSSQYYGKLKTMNGTIEKTCLLCPNKFRTSLSQDKKYCSRKCWAVSMKGNKNQSGKQKTLKELFDSLSNAELKTVL